MKFYFSIQLKRFYRLLISSGIHPIVSILFLVMGFAISTHLLFRYSEFASLIYSSIVVFLLLKLSSSAYISFLNQCFQLKTIRQIRLAENLMVAFPFIVGLVLYANYIVAAIIGMLALILSFFDFKPKSFFTLSTPFTKNPFEFIIGFRKSVLLLIGCYALSIIGLVYYNYNLSVFGFAILFLITPYFYLNSFEPILYLWIHEGLPQHFIIQKIKIGILHNLIITLPLFSAISVINPNYLVINVIILGLGTLFLITAILYKYAFYPKLSVVEEFGFVLCLMSPPILVIVIPILYHKAIKNLNLIIHDIN